jgi:hypothetical protein
MKKLLIQPQKATTIKPKEIRVKLDPETTIIIHRPSSLKIWKKQYPMAEVYVSAF